MRIEKVRTVFLAIVFFLSGPLLYADWNKDFDSTTRALQEQFSELKSNSYLKKQDFFVWIRKSLLTDPGLRKRFQDSCDEDKFMIIDKERRVVIKKRPYQRIHELYVWEVAHLLGAPEFVVPAFPIEIKGQKAVVQPMESFSIGVGTAKVPPSSYLKKIPLKDYWQSHLIAYIMGLGDLVGINIGVNERGLIRFFDTESSFKYHNTPQLSGKYFKTGFVMESFEWPQYRMALSQTTADELRNFVASLDNFEDRLSVYLSYRPLTIDEKGLFERLEKVRSFPLEEGQTFRDFYGHLFPIMSQGLDELNRIVSRILQRNVDHGASLLFACRRQAEWTLSSTDKKKLRCWINTYIEEEP